MRVPAILVLAAVICCGQHLQKALEYHRSGQMDAAIQEYRAFLKEQPKNVEARSNLAVALAHEGRYAEAIREYRAALEGAPGNQSIRLNLGIAYFKASELQPAIAELRTVHQANPGDLRVALLLADCHLRLGENKAVIEVLKPFEAGEDRAVWYLLGTALIRDNQTVRGQVLLDRLLRDGDSAEARLLIGTSKLMVKDFAGAREELEKAVARNPQMPEVYPYYAMSLLQTGDHDGAMQAFRKGLEQDPNDFECNLNFGALLKQDQRFEEAMPYLQRALAVRPGNLAALYQIAGVRAATAKFEAARGNLETLVKESPEFIEGHVLLATVFYRLKRKEDGDRERAIVEKLTAEKQALEPGAKPR